MIDPRKLSGNLVLIRPNMKQRLGRVRRMQVEAARTDEAFANDCIWIILRVGFDKTSEAKEGRH